jgi:hypothetical protein
MKGNGIPLEITCGYVPKINIMNAADMIVLVQEVAIPEYFMTHSFSILYFVGVVRLLDQLKG